MSEPNPYEPPREPEPLTTGQVVKRSVGVATTILLTPPAVVVAAAGGCGISLVARPPSQLLIPLISALVPFAALFGLMTWAVSIDRSERGYPSQRSRRAAILIAIVPIFGLAQILGIVMALGAFVAVEKAVNGGNVFGIAAGLAISGLTPFMTLLVMLWLAWRATD